MPVAYLTAAVFSGLTTALMWLYMDGAWWSALLVYVLSGNLVIAALLTRVYLRQPKPDLTQAGGEKSHATEA